MSEKTFSEKIIEFIRKQPVLFVFIIMGLVFLPIILVHLLFKIHAPWFLQAVWSAGELLGYFGSIIGAIATIFAIVVTIQLTLEEQKATYEHQKEERRLSIKPHFQTGHKCLINQDEIDTLKDGRTIYVTYPLNSSDAIPGTLTSAPHMLKSQDDRKDYYVFL